MPRIGGRRQRRQARAGGTSRRHRARQRASIAANGSPTMPWRTSAVSPGSGASTVPASGPSGVEGGQQPRPRLAARLGEPLDPRLDVHQVVALLAPDLGDELGQRHGATTSASASSRALSAVS